MEWRMRFFLLGDLSNTVTWFGFDLSFSLFLFIHRYEEWNGNRNIKHKAWIFRQSLASRNSGFSTFSSSEILYMTVDAGADTQT